MRSLARTFLILLVLGLISRSSFGQDLLMERTNAAAFDAALKKCDNLHHIGTCDVYHVERVEPTQAAVTLNGTEYRLTWSGTAVYLSSGKILEQKSDTEWIEIYPQEGVTHSVSSLGGALAASSTTGFVVLDGNQKEQIVDRRLLVRLSPQ